jgi:hypothetical protein
MLIPRSLGLSNLFIKGRRQGNSREDLDLKRRPGVLRVLSPLSQWLSMLRQISH